LAQKESKITNLNKLNENKDEKISGLENTISLLKVEEKKYHKQTVQYNDLKVEWKEEN